MTEKQSYRDQIRTRLDAMEESETQGSVILTESEGSDPIGDYTGFSKAVSSLIRIKCDRDRQITYLQNRIQTLEDEHFRDSELERMQNAFDRQEEDLRRGFAISEKEEKAIREWKHNHLALKHPKALENPSYFGAIGGNFVYEFTPTSIGTAGTVRCSCGEGFTFRSL